MKLTVWSLTQAGHKLAKPPEVNVVTTLVVVTVESPSTHRHVKGSVPVTCSVWIQNRTFYRYSTRAHYSVLSTRKIAETKTHYASKTTVFIRVNCNTSTAYVSTNRSNNYRDDVVVLATELNGCSELRARSVRPVRRVSRDLKHR